MQTSNQFIYAVGDAVSSFDPISNASRVVPLAGPAAKQALVAVNNIFGIKDSYQGTIGTAILKIFSLTCALTGNNEKTLKINNIGFNKVYTHPLNHAGYYPGASQMSIKLIFDNIDGKVLGAQIIGKDGVDKRIDILSVACQHKLKVEDLSKMELSYAPPYGSAKDPINLAGMAALNHIRGISKLEYWENLKEDDFLLDVRTEKEVSRAPVKNAYNIPVDSLRQRINEVPKDKKIAVFCHVGVRAHSAVRILMQNGFNAVNISGGFLTYKNL
ncbi:MAG: FAD-dependent pyridine nucleotide-disulfide oxidoreductase [uncultured bacterium]|nr:MAG: FAD-dependent pyridine nucleotide-disulfide oxidoreductase [uncultured bacterium]